MGGIWLRDLPDVLSGLPNVSLYDGWSNRSRSSGGYDALLGIAIHHTASTTTTANDTYYQWVTAMTGGGEGPIGAIYLGRAGEIVIGAAGATNCQGKGGPLKTSKGTIPQDKGNQNMIAIEAGNGGTGEPWPDAQQDAYVALVKALCDGYGFDANRDVYGHFDYCAPSCPGRKIDPAGPSRFGSVNKNGTWDINMFRAAVLGAAPTPTPPTPTPPDPSGWPNSLVSTLPTLEPGASGMPVKKMQHLLASAGFMDQANTSNYDGQYGSGTQKALNSFKQAVGGQADSCCDSWTWGALLDTGHNGLGNIVCGQSGNAVKRMQHLLAACGFMSESNVANYDGNWGSGTDKAKVTFDTASGLTPSPPTDCGQGSWTALLT
jgi:peptidoglycan hydrolase-like protein with peptidoglycan-binding domain